MFIETQHPFTFTSTMAKMAIKIQWLQATTKTGTQYTYCDVDFTAIFSFFVLYFGVGMRLDEFNDIDLV